MPDARPATGLRERKKRQLRDRLVSIAGRRFLRDGYAATNMRDIADEAGIAYQTLYNHFATKSRLGMAWLQTLTEEANATVLARATTVPDDPLAALLDGADLYLSLVADTDRELWRDVTAEYMRTPEAFGDAVRVFHLGAREQIGALIGHWQRAGALRPEPDPVLLGGVIYALVDHAMLRFMTVDALTPDTLIAELHDQLAMVLRPALPAGG